MRAIQARTKTYTEREMTLLADLRSKLDPQQVIDGCDVDDLYLGDWVLQDSKIKPAALVRPRTTADVSAIMRVCHAHKVPVVAQGGRTGLAGGATPADGWVILSLELMRRIDAPDTASQTIVVEAGAVLQSVQEAADGADLFFPLDIGGRGSCTIGGNISTNAGGNRVLRYGMMRDLVMGVEAVLPDGTIVSSMHPMLKNNTGYDLKQIFVGAEGTLGIVTRAILRLFPKPRSEQTALCAVKSYDDVLKLLRLARSRLGPTLSAFEVMWPLFYKLATDIAESPAPLPAGYGAYVLVENMGTDQDRDSAQFQDLMEAVFEEEIVADAVIAQTGRDRLALWSIRDASGELPKMFWPYVGFDVSIPIGRIGEFVDECSRLLGERWSDARSIWFGHAADSNIHICVRVEGAEVQPEKAIDDIVYDCVGRYAGSISAEHGIGVLKRDYLGASRSEAELGMMRTMKRALDPQNLLNPGKIFV